MAESLDPNSLARSLASLGIPITPILKNAGITTVSIDAFGQLEGFVDDQLRSIKKLLLVFDRLTSLHKDLQQYAPRDVRERHQHTVGALLTSFDDSLDLSSDMV